MKNDENQEPGDVIQKLVAAEEEEAFRRFRDRDFSARVIALVRAEEKGRRPSSFWQKIPVAAWTGAALLVLGAAIALIIGVPRGPRITTMQTIEDFLRQTPGVQGLLNQPAVAELNPDEIPSGFEKSILKTLAATGEERAGERSVGSETTPALERSKVPRLDLEKTYEILIQEKAIERVLSSLKKSKEV
jgi:hypothetical protein